MFKSKTDEKAIKEAFGKIKEDIFNLGSEVSQLRAELHEIKTLISDLNVNKANSEAEIDENTTSTDNYETSTHPATSTHNSTVPMEIGGLKYPNFSISTGNQGASTDRQTNRQTDTSTHNYVENTELEGKSIDKKLTEASEIMESLDDIKKEIRIKFKTMTQQEMLVFSTIYQLEEESPDSVDYRMIAAKIGLSESSIRDYVQRMINKGIPVLKTKRNNKKIALSISPELRKIASLQTILKLREI